MNLEQLDKWLSLDASDLSDAARVPVVVLPTREDVYERFAGEMFSEIADAHAAGNELRLIVPVGPTGQYPVLAKLLNEAGLPLHHVTFFGMDQCLDWQGRPLPPGHPFDFEAIFSRVFLDRLRPELRPPHANVIFPSVYDLDRTSEALGATPAATTYGGIGFRGHIAFNEPPRTPWTSVTIDDLRASRTRVVALSEDTLISQAHRRLGGNVWGVPPMAITLGMQELLSSKRIRLYTDAGAWKQTILRILLFSEPCVDFPVTLVQDHPDVAVVADAASAARPPME